MHSLASLREHRTRQPRHQRLKLNVSGVVMSDVLPPLLAEYRARHPGVEIEVVVEGGLVDIVLGGCDAGIRYGSVLEQDMISIPIGPRRQQTALAAVPLILWREP